MNTNIDFRLVFALMNGNVSAQLSRRLNDNFKAQHLSLTSEQWNVLLSISINGYCTQQQLCDATSMSKPTMTRIINRLEDQGIVIRSKSRVDWRSNYIRLTRTGQAVHDRARLIALSTLKDSLRGLTREQIHVAQDALRTVLANLNEMARQSRIDEQDDPQRARRIKLLHRLINMR